MRFPMYVVVLAVGLSRQAAWADLVITEVASTSGAPAGPLLDLDWWELTNTGPASVLLNGYEWEDNNPQGPGLDTAIFPSVSIAPGESIILHEGGSDVVDAFRTDWGLSPPVQILYEELFGGNNPFSGLSSGGDQINLYDDLGALVAMVAFPGSTPGKSFEWNTSGVSLGLSVTGENGAFAASNNREGSPGVAVPEPAAITLLGMAIGGLVVCGIRRRK